MTRLIWKPMRAPMPEMQQWGSVNLISSYVISCDRGCPPGDPYFGRFAASRKSDRGKVTYLGLYDTLEEAKEAVEAQRRRLRPQA
jgi:hypothetical protein